MNLYYRGTGFSMKLAQSKLKQIIKEEATANEKTEELDSQINKLESPKK